MTNILKTQLVGKYRIPVQYGYSAYDNNLVYKYTFYVSDYHGQTVEYTLSHEQDTTTVLYQGNNHVTDCIMMREDNFFKLLDIVYTFNFHNTNVVKKMTHLIQAFSI